MEESFEGKTRRQISGQKTFLEERLKASKRRAPENIRRLHLQWLQSLRLFHDQRRKVLQRCKCQNVPPPTFRSLSHMCAPIYASAKSAGSPVGPNGQRLASNALLVLSDKSLCCGPLLVSLCFLHVPPRRSRTYSLALLSLLPHTPLPLHRSPGRHPFALRRAARRRPSFSGTRLPPCTSLRATTSTASTPTTGATWCTSTRLPSPFQRRRGQRTSRYASQWIMSRASRPAGAMCLSKEVTRSRSSATTSPVFGRTCGVKTCRTRHWWTSARFKKCRARSCSARTGRAARTKRIGRGARSLISTHDARGIGTMQGRSSTFR